MKFNLYKYLLIFSLLPTFIFAQEFDESFLKSLPDDVASDLINRSQIKGSLEEPQYRRPSTFITKPDLNSDRFGAQVFSMMQSSLMPLNEPNFDGSYFLDFGDELELQLTGQKSTISKLNIKRDGSINIKDIGKIFIAGLSLDEAALLIKIKINESFIGVESFITLTNIRDIQIIMAGNVYNPGPYTLNGNSNIFHALSVSGGPSDFGSFRSIDLIRNDKIIESIDLYETFIFAKSNFKTRLRSGDIVFVNPVNNIITLNGSFKRPGTYELNKDENLSLAIFFANGINAYADESNIKLDRILDGKIEPLLIVNMSQFDNIKANDGDRIFVRSIPFRTINVSGAVLNPGSYLMNEGDTILDAISKAGGYSANAYPFGAVYENKETALINEMAVNNLYESFIDNILTISQQNPGVMDFSSIIEITSILKNSPLSGRVVVDFEDKDQENQILIKDGDTIIIPEYTNQVYVYGEVSLEGAALFKEGKDISYYLNKKGGLNKNADKKSIYILHPNGETLKVPFNKNIFMKQGSEVNIYAGSIIFIPRKLNSNIASRLTAQAYASILGDLGISLASISILKD